MSQVNKAALKHIIVGLDPLQFAPHLPIDIRLQQAPTLFRFLDDSDQRGQSGLALNADLELSLDSVIKQAQIRYDAWDVDIVFDPKDGDIIKIFGHTVATMQALRFSMERNSKNWPKHYMMAGQLHALHPRRLYYLEKFVKLAGELGARLTFYTNPLHPKLIEQLKANTPYVDRQLEIVDYVRSVVPVETAVHSFLTPSDYGGDDEDFIDGAHMGRGNGDRLVDYLLTTDGYTET